MTSEQSPSSQVANPKLFSYQAFALCTYLGGPLAAGIMAKKNFLTQNMAMKGWIALFTGIALTLLMILAALYLSSKSITPKDEFLLYLTFSGFNTLLVWLMQSDIIGKHKENNGEFYSLFKAGWLGIKTSISLYIFLIITLKIVLQISPESVKWLRDKFDQDNYSESIKKCLQHESEAVSYYNVLFEMPPIEALTIADSIMIPLFTSNKTMLKELKETHKIRADRHVQTYILLERNKLQIEKLSLIRQSFLNDSIMPWEEIEKCNSYISSYTKTLEQFAAAFNWSN